MTRSFAALSLSLLVTSVVFEAGEARAADPSVPMGAKGQLVIDQISGFRMNVDGNLSYYGPIGLSSRSYTQTLIGATGDQTVHVFTWWLAPSADYFVVDNISVGALIEFSQTSGSVDFPTGNGQTQNVSQPTTTSLTLLPRVGYFLPFGGRFGFWPRLGAGYVTRGAVRGDQNPQNQTKDSFGAFLLDLDAGILMRVSDYLFFKIAPDVSFSLAGSHTQETQGVSRSANANVFQVGATVGLGGIIPL